jgi:hypothetical protein
VGGRLHEGFRHKEEYGDADSEPDDPLQREHGLDSLHGYPTASASLGNSGISSEIRSPKIALRDGRPGGLRVFQTGAAQAHDDQEIGEVAQYKDKYRLCYMRGPAGIIVALAEELF